MYIKKEENAKEEAEKNMFFVFLFNSSYHKLYFLHHRTDVVI